MERTVVPVDRYAIGIVVILAIALLCTVAALVEIGISGIIGASAYRTKEVLEASTAFAALTLFTLALAIIIHAVRMVRGTSHPRLFTVLSLGLICASPGFICFTFNLFYCFSLLYSCVLYDDGFRRETGTILLANLNHLVMLFRMLRGIFRGISKLDEYS
ncbi:unnamed protein product [Echinostoma caproni]|uniref:MARVEL domain-containing protein n=1 Tax=Echinostoma caproni TaxID=27848 RepID=A0A183A773_9TREM|nr:unnamed protein product [Echinostoma caproni]